MNAGGLTFTWPDVAPGQPDNTMAMDYYGSFDGSGANMGSYAVQAAQNTLSFVKSVWPGDTYANIGVTPMIGQNEVVPMISHLGGRCER